MNNPLLITTFLVALGLISIEAVADIPDQIANDDPIAWWRFEDANSDNGDVAADSSLGGANPGTYSGNVALVTGIAGKAAYFDGSSRNSVFVGNMGALPTEGSIEMWFRADSFGNYRNPFTTGPLSNDATGNRAIRFEARDSGSLNAIAGNGTSTIVQEMSTGITTQEWHHIVFTWDRVAGTVDGFFDNQHLIDTSNSFFPDQLSDVRIGIGFADVAERNWHGRIDEVAIYDKQLTAARVGAHFTGVPEPGSLAVCSLLFVATCMKRRRTLN